MSTGGYIAAAVIGLILGPGALALGFWSLRTRAWRDSVPALELLIDRAIGEDPFPRTKTDQKFALVQAWLLTIGGGFMTALEIYALIDTILSE